MKYIFIDQENSMHEDNIIISQPERILWQSEEDSDIRYICEKCFKSFKNRNLSHLEKCDISWPIKGITNCSIYPTFMLFKLSSEKEYLENRIMKSVFNLALFSKLEQGLGTVIPKKYIIGKRYFIKKNISKFFCYVLFYYKNIVSYFWIQEYTSIFYNKKIVIRDLYVLPEFRGKNVTFRILKQIAKDYNKELNDLVFSLPISKKLKYSLKKHGINSFVGVDREDFNSLRRYEL